MTFEARSARLFVSTLVVSAILSQSIAQAAEEPVTTGSIVRSTAAAEGAADGAARPIGLIPMLFGDRDEAAETAVTAGKETRRAGKSEARTHKAGSRAASRAPANLRPLIHKHAKAHGIPPELAEAVISVESRFNPKARGRSGEIGLMQIKPATARGIGYRGSASGLYDPETNIAWGMRYLARAYDLADGDTCGAILRYNAGHAAKRMTRGAARYCAKVKTYVAGL